MATNTLQFLPTEPTENTVKYRWYNNDDWRRTSQWFLIDRYAMLSMSETSNAGFSVPAPSMRSLVTCNSVIVGSDIEALIDFVCCSLYNEKQLLIQGFIIQQHRQSFRTVGWPGHAYNLTYLLFYKYSITTTIRLFYKLLFQSITDYIAWCNLWTPSASDALTSL